MHGDVNIATKMLTYASSDLYILNIIQKYVPGKLMIDYKYYHYDTKNPKGQHYCNIIDSVFANTFGQRRPEEVML